MSSGRFSILDVIIHVEVLLRKIQWFVLMQTRFAEISDKMYFQVDVPCHRGPSFLKHCASNFTKSSSSLFSGNFCVNLTSHDWFCAS